MYVSPAIGNTNVGSSPSVSNHREIKFRYRLQHLTKNGYEEWFEIHSLHDLERCSFINSSTAKIISRDQYIGLNDKNGNEIYEQDILLYTRFNFKTEYYHKVAKDLKNKLHIFWEHNAFKFDMYDEERCFSSGSVGEGFKDDRVEKNEIEIIGNVYDNPELLRSVQ